MTTEDVQMLHSARENFATVSDECIAGAKEIILQSARTNTNAQCPANTEDMRMCACADFLYAFDASNSFHVFVRTSDEDREIRGWVMEGEADMHFATHATFDIVQLSLDF